MFYLLLYFVFFFLFLPVMCFFASGKYLFYHMYKGSMEEKWRRVMEDIKGGVILNQVPETEKTLKKTITVKLSEYDLLLMQISKYDKSNLKKAKTVGCLPLRRLSLPNGQPQPRRNDRRATVGDIHSTLMYEIKTHPTLRPASRRSLRPMSLSPRSRSPMESLMEEILTPPALKRVERKSLKRPTLFDQARLCKSYSDITELTSLPPLAPFPSANHLDRAGWKDSFARKSKSIDNIADDVEEDVFDSLVISVTPPVVAQTGSGSRVKANGSKPTTETSYTLTFDELSHISSVVAKAEAVGLQLKSMTLFRDVWKRKVCFRCHKKRFSCLRSPFTCTMCKRHVCSKCITAIINAKKGQSVNKSIWYICQFCWDFTLKFSSPAIFDH